MAIGDYVTDLKILELLRRLKSENPKDYDILVEMENRLFRGKRG